MRHRAGGEGGAYDRCCPQNVGRVAADVREGGGGDHLPEGGGTNRGGVEGVVVV